MHSLYAGILVFIFSFLVSAGSAFAATGYIHMHPSGKGYVDDAGVPFIPNGPNASLLLVRHWIDDPGTGREYVWGLGARGFSRGTCNTPDTPGMTFDQYFTELERAKMTHIRIFVSGSDGWAGNPIGMEVIPLGSYHVFNTCGYVSQAEATNPVSSFRQSLVNGANFASQFPNCRYPNFSDSACGSSNGPKLRASHLTRILSAAESHGVKVQITFTYYENEPWSSAVYNSANGGVVADREEYYTSSQARAFQKQKIDFINHAWGESTAIWYWEVSGEIEFDPGGWTSEGTQNRIAWINDLALHIKQKDTHDRPVSTSSWRQPEWIEGSRMNGMFASSALDLVDFHSYDDTLLAMRKTQMRQIQSGYNKAPFIGEYWPWTGQGTATVNSGLYVEASQRVDPPYEDKPWRPSRIYNFLQLVGSGSSTPARWDETGLNQMTELEKRTMSPLYEPMGKYIQAVNWSQWNIANLVPWDDRISATSTDFSIGSGDGDQIMLMVHGTGSSSSVTVTNLVNGTYSVKVFDFLSGNVASTATATASNGSVTFSLNLANSVLDTTGDGYDRVRFAVVLLEKQGMASPPPTPNFKQLITNWFTNLSDLNGDAKVNSVDFARSRQ